MRTQRRIRNRLVNFPAQEGEEDCLNNRHVDGVCPRNHVLSMPSLAQDFIFLVFLCLEGRFLFFPYFGFVLLACDYRLSPVRHTHNFEVPDRCTNVRSFSWEGSSSTTTNNWNNNNNNIIIFRVNGGDVMSKAGGDEPNSHAAGGRRRAVPGQYRLGVGARTPSPKIRHIGKLSACQSWN